LISLFHHECSFICISWYIVICLKYKNHYNTHNMSVWMYFFKNAIVVKISTISTTSTSAGILSWYKNVFRSFFIWMELSSVCATVNILNLQFFQVLCCFNKKGMSIRMPPSCTIHQISIVPDSYYTITYVYTVTDLLTVGRSKPLSKRNVQS